MKNKLFYIFLILTINVFSQSFNDEKTSMINFTKRMYYNSPFEGVKIIDDYNQKYLISVISLEKVKYTDPSTMNRVAQIKAQSQANTFLNGASISMEMIIKTTDKAVNDSTSTLVESIEIIKQNSNGFTHGLELLSNFENSDQKRMVYIYSREIIEPIK